MSPLTRTSPAPPVRIVHLGLGSFFRAHQAWYTAHAPDAQEWGIAAFTGRRPDLADALAPQDGLYTLVTRDRDGDRFEVVPSLASAHPAADSAAWLALLADPQVAVLSLTVTEAGYRRGADGGLDLDEQEVQADLAALRGDLTAPVSTVPARILAGLAARWSADAGPLAVLPCDNLPHNGAVAARVVGDLAAALDPALASWVEEHVSFVTTMVDRITPEPTAEDAATVLAATGVDDRAPVVTEPFSEWVISGTFPRGRPRWEDAGATVTDELGPYEQRKLWLLNGAHSLLAYAGSGRGHETVADAVADPSCRDWVQQWWAEASSHLPQPPAELASYREALLGRFANPRMRHRLDQIAADGSQKLPVRVVPALLLERAAGRPFPGAARVLAAWVLHLRGRGAPLKDARADDLRALAQGDLREAVTAVLAELGGPELAADDVVDAVTAAATELEGR